MLFRILLVWMLFFVTANGAELLWPLPGHQTITGGFADVRPDHFHGGVDVSTGRQSIPVIAPEDGWIERIAVTPGGYGRVLYFRISDDRTAVFAHLDRFRPVLETMLRDSELAVGTYRVDFSFENSAPERCFKAGDTLAFTGCTGAGPAHFHYEIREGAVQTDPLAYYKRPDDESPIVTSVAWISLSSLTPWNPGRNLKLTKTGSGRWRTEAIRSREPVALLIRTHDPNPWMRPAVPTVIRLQVNGQTVFENRATRIDLLGPRDIYTRTVWPDRTRSRMGLRRLFEMIPKSGRADSLSHPAGWLSGLNNADVQIEVEDRAGNITRCEIAISAGAWPPSAETTNNEDFNCGAFTLSTKNDPTASWAVLEQASSDREIRIGPAHFAFGDRLRLSYSAQDFRGHYFYELTSKGGRKPLSVIKNSASNDPVCLILRSGTYGVGEDTEPPNLTLSVRKGIIRFRISDGLSGVDDGSIRCSVDGLTAIAEFEYEERGGDIWTPQPLSKGSHTVVMTAADRAGNERIWSNSIIIP
ncbi:M23 family metallopeptidase [candidate division KSB1 bacterium]|nr:MAG: M23 family metallopeptidase [candidate division KSB1 bacterium]